MAAHLNFVWDPQQKHLLTAQELGFEKQLPQGLAVKAMWPSKIL